MTGYEINVNAACLSLANNQVDLFKIEKQLRAQPARQIAATAAKTCARLTASIHAGCRALIVAPQQGYPQTLWRSRLSLESPPMPASMLASVGIGGFEKAPVGRFFRSRRQGYEPTSYNVIASKSYDTK